MPIESLLILGLLVFLAYGIESATGFGSIVIAVSVGIFLWELDVLIPILVALNISMTIPIAYRNLQHIHKQLLLNKIIPLTLVGLIIGTFLFPLFDTSILKVLFASLILWFSSRSLFSLLSNNQDQANSISHGRIKTAGLMVGAGITHGMFASGGPLLVYSLLGQTLTKQQLRNTLIAVWALLNSSMVIIFIVKGGYNFGNLTEIVFLLPFILTGAWLGGKLHARISEHYFRVIISILLLMISIGLFIHSFI